MHPDQVGVESLAEDVLAETGRLEQLVGALLLLARLEANEEVALDPADARLLGYMPAYFTGSNYLITPVVAEVVPRRDFVPNPGEVKTVFEVPLPLLMREESFGTFRIRRKEQEHTTWQIEHGGLVIWGITANLTRLFYERVLKYEVSA